MAKKIRFFREVLWSGSVRDLLGELDTANGSDIDVDLFTYGGETQPTWTLYKEVKEYKGNTSVSVDGLAASMGVILMAAFDKRRMSDTAKLMLHAPSGSLGDKTDEIRESLYNALASIIDEAAFEKEFSKKLKDVMFAEGDQIENIWLNSKQAKKIGLVNEVYKLTPKQLKNVADLVQGKSINNTSLAAVLNINQNLNRMTLEKLKAEHPAIYQQVYNVGLGDGMVAGAKKELSRVKAALPWLETDQETVVNAIKEGKEIDNEFISDMSAKAISKAKLDSMNNEDSDATETDASRDKPDEDGISDETKAAAKATIERLTGKKS